MSKIFIVDDQRIVCYSLQRLLQSQGYETLYSTSSLEALEIAKEMNPDLIIMDVRMPEMDGIEVLKQIKDYNPKIQVIMMTAFSTTEKAIEAMRLGAFDYLTKPFDNDDLLIRIKDALKARYLMQRIVTFDEIDDYDSRERIIGSSPAMLNIYKQIGKIAQTDTTVLIKGESGTGKELIARAIYHYSNRAKRPFLAINCSAIPENLLESELFGYEKGAFTGADFKKIGKFEQCNGGTIFLDEIGDMPISIQAKFLRVLQDGRFQRLGGTETIDTDIRIISATNKDLEEMVKKNTFREDLYYRINVVTIDVPPLRERKEDIKELVAYFIKKYNAKFSKNIKGITQETLHFLENKQWYGNVRELENVIQRAIVFCSSDYISQDCCETITLKDSISPVSSLDEVINNLIDTIFKTGNQERLQEIVNMIESAMVKRALDLTKGNQVHAAKILGISRNTLRKKMGEDSI